MSGKISGLTVRQMRRMASEIGMSVYWQGGNWIVSSPSGMQIPLHYSITTERIALADGLGRAGLVRMVTTYDGGVDIVDDRSA